MLGGEMETTDGGRAAWPGAAWAGCRARAACARAPCSAAATTAATPPPPLEPGTPGNPPAPGTPPLKIGWPNTPVLAGSPVIRVSGEPAAWVAVAAAILVAVAAAACVAVASAACWVAVAAAPVPVKQSTAEIVLESIVTAPFRAKARPNTVAPVVSVIEVKARIFPRRVEFVPRVAELVTCQKTLQYEPPLITLTWLDEPVTRLEVAAARPSPSWRPAAQKIRADDDGLKAVAVGGLQKEALPGGHTIVPCCLYRR